MIFSSQNKKVKGWSQLKQKKYRDQTNAYIAEGIHVVKEAILAKASIEAIVYDMACGVPKELETYYDSSWIAVTKEVIEKCSETKTPQPIFAIIRKNKPLTKSVFSDYGLILDGIQDPGNMGSLIRSACATGIKQIFVTGRAVDIYHPKVIRSTMGALFHVQIFQEEVDSKIMDLKRQGKKIIGATLQASKLYYDHDFTRPSWVMIGSEAEGISKELLQHLDEQIFIPQIGPVESLNAAMACTVILYEMVRQKQII